MAINQQTKPSPQPTSKITSSVNIPQKSVTTPPIANQSHGIIQSIQNLIGGFLKEAVYQAKLMYWSDVIRNLNPQQTLRMSVYQSVPPTSPQQIKITGGPYSSYIPPPKTSFQLPLLVGPYSPYIPPQQNVILQQALLENISKTGGVTTAPIKTKKEDVTKQLLELAQKASTQQTKIGDGIIGGNYSTSSTKQLPSPSPSQKLPPTTPSPTTLPSLTSDGLAAFLSELEPFLKNQQLQTNAPPGASIEVYKDPLGGSTPIFFHLIQPGENLSKIAKKYGVTVDEILRINEDNKMAIKSPDLIIAGEQIRIPLKVSELTTEDQIRKQLFSISGNPLQQINQQISQTLDQLKTGIIPESVFSNLFFKTFQDQISSLQEILQRMENIGPVNYQEQYQRLLEQLGISEDYKRIFDLQKIIKKTRDDVVREAIASGGIVTESQIEAIVNFRISMLKDELETIVDLVELKERMIDKTLKYIEMDRKQLNDYFDRILDIKSMISKFNLEALQWGYDFYKDLINKNRTKLMNYVKDGTILELSLDVLSNFANPSSMLYADVTPEEIAALLRTARILREREEIEKQKIINDIKRSISQQRIQEERLQIEREKLKLRQQEIEEDIIEEE